MKGLFLSGLFLLLIMLSGRNPEMKDQITMDILKSRIIEDIKSNWSDFDTMINKTITLELGLNIDTSISIDKNRDSARFSYVPGFYHKFYLISSGTDDFYCSLKLYKYNAVNGFPNKLIKMVDISGGSDSIVSFTRLLDTKNEWLLVLEKVSDEEGMAFAMSTTQIPENDALRRRIYEKNREVMERRRMQERSRRDYQEPAEPAF